MAWTKIPEEHHPIFMEALPDAPDVKTIRMFGGLAAMVNGNMACGLFGRSAMARLSSKDQERVLAMEGGERFDPMGNGRTMKDTVMLPESVMESPRELGKWLKAAIDFTRTLPAKKKAGSKKVTTGKKVAKKKAVKRS